MPETKNVFHAKDRKAWRKWLEKHHRNEQSVMLVRYKKHTSIWNGDQKKYFELKDQLPVLAKQKILEVSYPEGIGEFFLAANVNYWLADIGLTPATRTIYGHFMTNYKNSVYRSTPEKNYNEWVSISEGRPSPEITGTTINGDTLRLSDLKGKVVYVDIWATWCRPCVEEFPHSKTLVKEFDQDDEVAFLFVSVDRNINAWKNFINKKNPPKGIHIREINNDQRSVQEAFKIRGIPRYFLIDHNGDIKTVMAPGPSSGKVQDMIRELLAKQKVM